MVQISQWRRAAFGVLRACFSKFVRSSAEKGHFEVERKFAISAEEAASLPERLKAFGYVPAGTVHMTDAFLPNAVEGEMMRVRQERLDDGPVKAVLTFKQWVARGTGKERQETECAVSGTVAACWVVIGRLVKGSRLLSFSKERQLFDGKLAGSAAVVSIDKVMGLGNYSGFYMEVEVLVPLDGDTDRYKDAIFEFVEQLFGQRRENEQKSYRDMLVASRQA